MNKNIVSVILSGVVLSSGAVAAMDFNPTFSVGAELQNNRNKVASEFSDQKMIINNKPLFRKNSGSAGLFVAARFNDTVGAELGYNFFVKTKETNSTTETIRKTKMHNSYADLLGYLLINDAADFIGAMGIGRLSTTVEMKKNGITVAQSSTESAKAGVRLGLGAQYKFGENFGTRLMVRHQRGNKIIKNINSANLALFYQF